MRAVSVLAPAVLVAALSASSRALAQSPPAPAAEPSHDRGGDEGDLSGFRLSAPLRLSLEGSVIPRGDGSPNCVSREDAAGNSVGGFPVQRYAQWRLTPRLVLSGFSQGGCPIDAGIGVMVTYAVPLRPSLRLVFGAGMYAAPGQIPLFAGAQASPTQLLGSLARAATQGLKVDSPVKSAARVDLAWTAERGHPYAFGVESTGETHTLKFSGGF
jgi:hypothetical protein